MSVLLFILVYLAVGAASALASWGSIRKTAAYLRFGDGDLDESTQESLRRAMPAIMVVGHLLLWPAHLTLVLLLSDRPRSRR